MMKNKFKRYELKYMLNRKQYESLKKLMRIYMIEDGFGKTTISNIYYDTDEAEIISRSIEKPVYKEKLRVRSYGKADNANKVFIELKKKYQGVVYKRRISMSNEQMKEFMVKDWDNSSQIAAEIKYYQSRFADIKPAMFIAYDREAYFAINNNDFRITLDQNIIYRDYDLGLEKEVYGESLLEENQILLEVKTVNGLPLWLRKFFDENNIYKISFSKYGRIHQKTARKESEYLRSYMLSGKREYNYAKFI